MPYNKIILEGNLVRDWELRYTDKGTCIGSNSIAVNRRWKDDSGDEQEEVMFVELVLFGDSAETAEKYQQKGSRTLIDGRLVQDTWEDKKSGEKRSKHKVIVERFVFLDSANGDKDDDRRERDSGKRDRDRNEDRPRRQRQHDYSEDDDSDKDKGKDREDRRERSGKRKNPF